MEESLLEERIPKLIEHSRPQKFPRLPVEVHILLSKRNFLMGLWAGKSFQHFSRRNWSFVFHDDGSLTKAEEQGLQFHFPDGVVVRRADADQKMEDRLKLFPKCLESRKRQVMFLKLFDPFFYSQTDRYILLDSDVLFFRQPEEIMEWARSPEPVFRFNADCSYAYSIPAKVMEERFEMKLWLGVNAGLALIPRKGVSMQVVEQFLQEFAQQSTHDLWLEQTAYALLASLDGAGSLLPATYEMSFQPSRQEGCVARHYVGSHPPREYFFREGIVTLASELL